MSFPHRFFRCIRGLSLWGAFLFPGIAAAQHSDALLADTTRPPTVEVSWPTHDKTIAVKGERQYKAPSGKSSLGHNIDCYVALGGTRLDKGQGSPDGAIVRVGLYKKDIAKPFFHDIKPGSSISISLRQIAMSHPAVARPNSALMHLRYGLTDLKNCGLDPTARNLYIFADPEDPVIRLVQADSLRPDALDGKSPDHGTVAASADDDGTVSFTITFPYALLRHLRDPYQRSDPGTFFEPQHFHVEVELLPKPPTLSPPASPSTPNEPPKSPDPIASPPKR
ncbi:MAG: hypothetical protein ACKVW3_15055 [Phycisphaerales bacterium]